ncbi:MAG: hypothetical protein ABIH89_08705 [Elusimicrobiota bacterium]
MFNINIIRDKAITPELKKKVLVQFITGAVGVAGTMVILILIMISTSVRMNSYEKKKDEINLKVEALIEKYSIEEWGKEWLDSYREVTVIHGIFSERALFSMILRDIVRMLSDDMCIAKIEVGKNQTKMLLKVIALAEEGGEFTQVKEFSDKLETSKLFGSGIRLESQERATLYNRDVNVITISIPLKENG